jgi:hypothetical protein
LLLVDAGTEAVEEEGITRAWNGPEKERVQQLVPGRLCVEIREGEGGLV